MFHGADDLSRLRELRRTLEMGDAAFGSIWQATPVKPLTEGEVTEFIRERTDLWRRTWVFPLIDHLIRKEEAKREKAAARRGIRKVSQ